VEVHHGDDRVELFGKARLRDRRAHGHHMAGGAVGIAIGLHGLVLLGGVFGTEFDEFGRLEGIDLALVADCDRQQARHVPTAHNVIADLLAAVDLGEGQQLAGLAVGVARLVRLAGDVGDGGRIIGGLIGRCGFGLDRLAGAGGKRGAGKGKDDKAAHDLSPLLLIGRS
jgi:hypothetical protein